MNRMNAEPPKRAPATHRGHRPIDQRTNLAFGIFGR